MNKKTLWESGVRTTSNYESPRMEVIEIAAERGFEASESEFEGPTYGEEDVEW